MTAIRRAWEQWEGLGKTALPTETRANACFAAIGKGVTGFERPLNACRRARVNGHRG